MFYSLTPPLRVQHECGSAYTDRMEQLFKDVDISLTTAEMYADVEVCWLHIPRSEFH